MTTKEIQRVLRKIYLERSAAVLEREPHPDAEMVGILESNGQYVFKPSPGRTTLTLVGFSFARQD